MHRPEIRQLADPEAVCREAAAEFVTAAQAATAARGRFTVVLSGGSTPRRLFELLTADPSRAQVDWTKVEFFWGDERAVPPDHPDSNFRLANETLLLRVGVPAARIHRLPADRADLDAAAAAYQAEIARVFGVSPEAAPPPFDLVFLGMGADGHTASLFPYTSALHENARWVVANHVPQLGVERLTLTPVIFDRAGCIIFLVTGTDKAAVLAEVLEGPVDPERLPSQLIRPVSGRVIWLVDRAAAARLGQKGS